MPAMQKMNEWLCFCDNLNTCVLDKIFMVPNFHSKTLIIPPVPEYKGRTQRLRSISDNDDDSLAKGFDAENYVRSYFSEFGPGGVYLSSLKILLLVAKHCSGQLPPSTPSAVRRFLENNAVIQIDGIFIHPNIGLVAIEIKAVAKSIEADSKQLPTQIKGKARKQLERIEQFIKGLYHIIFEEPMSIPFYKVVCAPNSLTGQSSVGYDLYLLDKQSLNADDGVPFANFWRSKMTFVGQDTATFRKIAAVLISLKTAFDFVSRYACDSISETSRSISQHESLCNAKTRPQQCTMMKADVRCFYWLNPDQQTILSDEPGLHYLNGAPGSGKTLLLMARMLRFLLSSYNRRALLFCPPALKYLYQQFVNDNNIRDRVKINNFSTLCTIADLYNKNQDLFASSEHAEFRSEDVDVYCDELDFSTLVKTKLFVLLKSRPETGAETFIVGESPEAAKNTLNDIFNLAVNNFATRYLKTIMRNSKEIMIYYKTNFDHEVLIGHSTSSTSVKIINCKNSRMALGEIVNCVRGLLEKEHKLRDLAIISMNRQKREIDYALQISEIATKNLANNSDAVTILSPAEIKSYEWKGVIISLDYDHERELALAVSRAITDLIIVKDTAYEKTIEELKKNKGGSPEEMLMKVASSDHLYEKLQLNFENFPKVYHKEYKPTKHCKTAKEYKNWCIYGTLQECGYSSKTLQRLQERLRFEQNNIYDQRINKILEITRAPDGFSTIPRSKRRDSINSMLEFSTSRFENSDLSPESNLNHFAKNIILRSSLNAINSTRQWLQPFSTAQVSRLNDSLNRGFNHKFNKSNMSRNSQNPRIQVVDYSYRKGDAISSKNATIPKIENQNASPGEKSKPLLTVEIPPYNDLSKQISPSSRRMSSVSSSPSTATIEEETEHPNFDVDTDDRLKHHNSSPSQTEALITPQQMVTESSQNGDGINSPLKRVTVRSSSEESQQEQEQEDSQQEQSYRMRPNSSIPSVVPSSNLQASVQGVQQPPLSLEKESNWGRKKSSNNRFEAAGLALTQPVKKITSFSANLTSQLKFLDSENYATSPGSIFPVTIPTVVNSTSNHDPARNRSSSMQYTTAPSDWQKGSKIRSSFNINQRTYAAQSAANSPSKTLSSSMSDFHSVTQTPKYSPLQAAQTFTHFTSNRPPSTTDASGLMKVASSSTNISDITGNENHLEDSNVLSVSARKQQLADKGMNMKSGAVRGSTNKQHLQHFGKWNGNSAKAESTAYGNGFTARRSEEGWTNGPSSPSASYFAPRLEESFAYTVASYGLR